MPRKNSSSKRFGARYGSKVRKNVDEAESGDDEYERVAAGIWKNKETGEVKAGGAFRPDTGAEEMMNKALKVETEELEEAKEKIEDE
ncbi:MAG: 50S ribosomal protein L37ae [Nanohaloarchaea archaeon]|nr:50S ribosomal protein L37ae [Candidatus Nanohaloarchaea archaeon]